MLAPWQRAWALESEELGLLSCSASPCSLTLSLSEPPFSHMQNEENDITLLINLERPIEIIQIKV